jgi:hypothetical protein
MLQAVQKRLFCMFLLRFYKKALITRKTGPQLNQIAISKKVGLVLFMTSFILRSSALFIAAILSALMVQAKFTIATNTHTGPEPNVRDSRDTLKSPSSLVIRFDLTNAKQTISLLGKQQLTEGELDQWVKLPGTQALISKVKSSSDTAISAIKKVVAHQSLTAHEKRFQYEFIYNNLPQMQQFIKKLDESRDSIITVLKVKLGQYLPAGKQATITLYGLMGSYSAGFAFTKDPNAFYMGLHFYKNDIQAVTISAEHELFHTLQTVGYDYKPVMKKMTQVDSSYEAPYYLIRHLYLEGSAQYIADGKPYIATSPFLKNEYDHSAVNDKRQESTFYLVEHLLLDVYGHRASMNFDHVYSILFDWDWNNPAYYAGKEMIAALVKAHGEQYIHQSLQKDALFFVRDYITLTKTKTSSGLYAFSGEFEKLVDNMIDELK